MPRASVRWLIPFIAFLTIFLWFINDSYPLIGHDYAFNFPRLLAGKWHALRQGILPMRFIVQLCGALPYYGNPQDLFYSLPQFLGFFLDLWLAARVTMVVFLVIGYAGWFRAAKDLWKLETPWAHVLALVIVANGYFFQHMLVGHLTFHSIPVFGWLLWLLFDRAPLTRERLALRVLAFAGIVAYILHSGGNVVLLQMVLCAAAYLPVDWLLAPPSRSERRAFGWRLSLASAAVASLCASKLVAVYSTMRFFPRTVSFHTFAADESTAWFILKSFWGMPQDWTLFDHAAFPDRIYEYGMFLSPIVAVGLACAIAFLARDWRNARARITVLILWLLLIGVFFFQLTRGYGLLVDHLQQLPLFSSIRIQTRFLYVPSLLLSCAGVVGLARMSTSFPRWDRLLAAAACVVTLLFFAIAHYPLVRHPFVDRTLDYEAVLQRMQSSDFLHKPVDRVMDLRGLGALDFEYIAANATGVDCYEPLLAGNTFLRPLREGTIDDTLDGSFNLNNPACLQYPEENGCRPGDHIALDDEENLRRLVNGERTTWKISSAQRTADAITLASITCILITLAIITYKRLRRR